MHDVLLKQGAARASNLASFAARRTGSAERGRAMPLFVPPPPSRLDECLAALGAVPAHPERTPPLIKAALAHVQFETIHPFLDGNGRVGRLLMTLLLCSDGALSEPLLYVSLYLKKHRARYYELLDTVRKDGDWEEWLGFFADGVESSASGAVTRFGASCIRRTATALGAGAAADRRQRAASVRRPAAASHRAGRGDRETERRLPAVSEHITGGARRAWGRPRDHRPSPRACLHLREVPRDPERRHGAVALVTHG